MLTHTLSPAQFESTARGFRTVASNDSHFYLLYGQPASKYWVDIADGLNASQRALLLGGSVSAWGDEYCYIAYCSGSTLSPFFFFPHPTPHPPSFHFSFSLSQPGESCNIANRQH